MADQATSTSIKEAAPKSLPPHAFWSLNRQVVTLSAAAPPGYPSDPQSGFIGSRQRTAIEKALQCEAYARLGTANELPREFTPYHWARLEGYTAKGENEVYSWVNGQGLYAGKFTGLFNQVHIQKGFSPSTLGGTGDFVIYSTMAYLIKLGFKPKK